MSAKFYIRYANEQNFIFELRRVRLNLNFELARDRLRGYSRRAKFRLPRRINFRSPARLNLKPLCFGENLKLALTIEFKARLLKPVRAPRNFKIYRATLVCHVNLDTAFARLNFKSHRLALPRKFLYRFGTLKFKIARCGVNLIRSERYSVILVGSPKSLFISEIKISLPSCAPFASSARPALAARTLLLVSRGFAA